jgi:hypothetical protein
MKTVIFSIENWWRLLIIITLIVGAFVFFRSLAKQLFGKSQPNDVESNECTGHHSIPSTSRNKRTDIASIDSGTNISTAASIVIDAATML